MNREPSKGNSTPGMRATSCLCKSSDWTIAHAPLFATFHSLYKRVITLTRDGVYG